VDKESDLTKLNGDSEERSTLANAQEIEIIALKTQVEALKKALDGVSAELNAIEDYRTAEGIELKSANEELINERGELSSSLGCLTKAQSSSSICATRSRSRARPKPICAEVPSRSRAVPIPPSRT